MAFYKKEFILIIFTNIFFITKIPFKSKLIHFTVNKKSYISIVNNTTFKRWYDDFYLDLNNTYNNYSYTMVECSATFRKNLTNFSFIN